MAKDKRLAEDPILERFARDTNIGIPKTGPKKLLPRHVIRQTIYIENLESLQFYIGEQRALMNDRLRNAKGLFYLIIVGVLVAAIAFIIAGLGLVYLGASGNAEVRLLGLHMTTTNVGVVSIAFGAVVLVSVVQRAMHHIQEILKIRSDK